MDGISTTDNHCRYVYAILNFNDSVRDPGDQLIVLHNLDRIASSLAASDEDIDKGMDILYSFTLCFSRITSISVCHQPLRGDP